MRNPAKEALTRVVNKAIANGAPLYVNRNSFQQWAITEAEKHGATARETGNWVELSKGGVTETCMSEQGVKAFLNNA